MGQRPLLCPLHGARCDATPARTCITMSRYEAQYGTGGLIPASTLTLIIPESSSDLYEDLLSLPPSVPSGSSTTEHSPLARLRPVKIQRRWLPTLAGTIRGCSEGSSAAPTEGASSARPMGCTRCCMRW